LPLWETLGFVRMSGLDVAPAMSVYEVPALVLTCHRIVGAGDPEPVAENEALAP
jgi:hypothetical protein